MILNRQGDRCECSRPGYCQRHCVEKDLPRFLRCVNEYQIRQVEDVESVERGSKAKLDKLIPGKIDIDLVKINLLGHDERQFENISKREYLCPYLLQDLDLGEFSDFQDNRFAEIRAFFCPQLFESEYTGMVTASWNHKYSNTNNIDNLHEWANLGLLFGDPKVVLCANTMVFDWNAIARLKNPSEDSVEYFVRHIGIDEICNIAPISNQFICHKSVMSEICEFVKTHIRNFISFYDLVVKPRRVGSFHEKRKIAVEIEFLIMYYMASRPDLHIISNEEMKNGWYLTYDF